MTSRVLTFTFLLAGLCSCGIFFQRKSEPKAKVCFFDPNTNSIVYRGKNEGIKKIEIVFITEFNKYLSSYSKENYNIPVNMINLSKMDTSLFRKNYVLIKIWEQSPVLEDYDIRIEPQDWNGSKLVYSRYNTR
jgi:hypothetical protein